MVDENYGFCPHCGENLKSDAVYCPACGTVLRQEAAQQQYHSYANYGGKTPMSGAFLVAFIMLVLYAVLELFSSASLLTFNSEMYDTLDQILLESSGMTLSEIFYDSLGVTVTKEQFLNEMFVLGLTGVVSAILAGISAFLCFKRKGHKYAVALCVLSAVVYFIGCCLAPVTSGAMSGIFSLLIGLLVAYLIYSSKRFFTD